MAKNIVPKREDEVVFRRAEIVFGVAGAEPDIGREHLLRTGPGDVEKVLAAVDADHPTEGRDPAGERDCGVAEAATDIEDRVVEADIEPRHDDLAVARGPPSMMCRYFTNFGASVSFQKSTSGEAGARWAPAGRCAGGSCQGLRIGGFRSGVAMASSGLTPASGQGIPEQAAAFAAGGRSVDADIGRSASLRCASAFR
ncbi:MAG: hypothetical protein R3D80_12530 [Paracoccaceae bacterium]